jgi:hypothetical protein
MIEDLTRNIHPAGSNTLPRRVDLPLILVYEILKMMEDLPKDESCEISDSVNETITLIKDHLLSELA